MNYNHLSEVYDDYLEHYGILGMKWGVRRYQNADGTLTAAGKKRYAGDTPEQIAKSEQRKAQVVKTAKVIGKTAAIALVAGVGSYTGSRLAARGTQAVISVGANAIDSLTNSGTDKALDVVVKTAVENDNPFNVTKNDVKQLLENYGDMEVEQAIIQGYIPKDLGLEVLWSESAKYDADIAGVPESIAKQIFLKGAEEAIKQAQEK